MKTCTKKKFSDFEAMLAVFNAKISSDSGNSSRRERRYYFCNECKAYHLSSKPKKSRR